MRLLSVTYPYGGKNLMERQKIKRGTRRGTRSIDLIRFDSMSEAVAFVCDESQRHAKASRSSTTKDSRSDQWDWKMGWDGALNAAKHGWPEGARRMRKAEGAAKAAVPPAKSKRIRPTKRGGRLNYTDYRMGKPRMFRKRTNVKHLPAIHLIVNISASAGVTAEEFTTQGVTVLACAYMLQKAGYPVEVDIVSRADRGLYSQEFYIPIKRPGMAFDEDAFAFWIAHPAALRRIGFAIMERSVYLIGKDGYGSPGIPTEAPKGSFKTPRQYLGEAEADRVRFVLNHLKEQGLGIDLTF